MELFHIVVLALIQGITEFLPISSSAHLLLPKALLGWPDQGLAFDVAVHVGSLCAVVFYFRHDIRQLVGDWLNSVSGGSASDNSRLAWYIIVATIPAGLFGLLMNDVIEAHLRSMTVVAITTVAFGLLLGVADSRTEKVKNLTQLTLLAVIVIGCAQALALIPGTSRSGITITAALMLGFQRESAARFSFLLSIPIIILSGGYKALSLLDAQGVIWSDLALGVLFSGISAYLCIHCFLRVINRIGMMPFVIYRLLLGGLLGLIILSS